MYTSSVQLRLCPGSVFFSPGIAAYIFISIPRLSFFSLSTFWEWKELGSDFLFFILFIDSWTSYLTLWWICEFLEEEKWGKKWIKVIRPFTHFKHFPVVRSLFLCMVSCNPYCPYSDDGQFGLQDHTSLPWDILPSLSPFWVDFILLYFVF